MKDKAKLLESQLLVLMNSNSFLPTKTKRITLPAPSQNTSVISLRKREKGLQSPETNSKKAYLPFKVVTLILRPLLHLMSTENRA